MGESPTQFNNDPGNLPTVETQILTGVIMSINWKDFFTHFAVQIGAAAVTAALAAVMHFDYSSLGVLAPMIQGAAALATTALAADGWHAPKSRISPATLAGLRGATRERVEELGRQLAQGVEASESQAASAVPLSSWARVAQVGEFTGFGGVFDEPPLVLDGGPRGPGNRHRFWAQSGEAVFRIDADAFGWVCRPAPGVKLGVRLAESGNPAQRGAPGTAPGAVALYTGGTLVIGAETRVLPELAGATSYALLQRAIAVTTGDSHRIRIFAPAPMPI